MVDWVDRIGLHDVCRGLNWKCSTRRNRGRTIQYFGPASVERAEMSIGKGNDDDDDGGR